MAVNYVDLLKDELTLVFGNDAPDKVIREIVDYLDRESFLDEGILEDAFEDFTPPVVVEGEYSFWLGENS